MIVAMAWRNIWRNKSRSVIIIFFNFNWPFCSYIGAGIIQRNDEKPDTHCG
jgi:hypothetical protein